jgi:hypothetical protein
MTPQEKAERRREAAFPNPPPESVTRMNISVLCRALAESLGDVLFPDDSNDTFAVGMYNTELIVAAKMAKYRGEEIAELIARHYRNFWPDARPPTIIAGNTQIPSGLHAEMAIVARAIERFGAAARREGMDLESKGIVWQLGHVLHVACLGKRVCPDCAGWMTRHRIPHFSVRKENGAVTFDYEVGRPSQAGLWVHPRTGTKFTTRTPRGQVHVVTHEPGYWTRR